MRIVQRKATINFNLQQGQITKKRIKQNVIKILLLLL